MSAINEAIDRLKRMRTQTPVIAKQILESKGALIADLNKGQLQDGKTAVGNDMPNYVSNSKAPKAPGRIQLFDTGDFQGGFKTKFGSSQLDVFSTDNKMSFLDPKYPTALGLNSDSISKLQFVLKQELPDKLRAI